MLSPSVGGSQFGSSQLATAFQNAYTNSLLGKNSLGTSASLATVVLGSAQAPGLNSIIPGSNPIAPLAGVPALKGLDQFVSSIETTSAQRKAGLLDPPASSGGGLGDMLGSLMGSLGGDNSNGLGALGSLTDLLSGSTPGKKGGKTNNLLDDIDPDVLSEFQSMLGGGANDISFDTTTTPSKSKGNVSVAQDAGDELMGQLMSMFSQLQSLFQNLGGDPSTIPGAGTGQKIPTTGKQITTGAQQVPGQQMTGNQLSQSTSQVQAGQQIYTRGLNFNLIDQAINNTLGGISATLPLVNI